MTESEDKPKIRISKNLIEIINKDEFCVLAYYQTSQPKTLKEMQRLLGIGSDRIIRTLSSLKEKALIQGKSTRPETVELMPTALPTDNGDVCWMPTWVLFTVKGRAADKQVICYYFREREPFDGTVVDLASGIHMKRRNVNYCLEFMENKKVIKKSHVGHKIKIELQEQPRRGILNSLFG